MEMRRIVAVLGVAAAVAVGCGPPPPAVGTDPNVAPRATEAAYAEAGPYSVGVTTLPLLGDRQVEVWYPADAGAEGDATPDTYFLKDFLGAGFQSLLPADVNPPFVTDAFRLIPAAEGRFPLVLFSHGASSYRLQSSFLTTHLASWGFVVLSPDFLERGLQNLGGTPPATPRSNIAVLEATIDVAKSLDTEAGGLLEGRIDTSRVFPVGHSAGGGASTQLAGARADVPAWISLSGGAFAPMLNPLPPAPRSALWMVGLNDQIANPAGVAEAWQYTPGEGRFVGIAGAGHNNAFTDICTIGGAGGPVGLAIEAGLPVPDFIARLGNDGCLPPNKASEDLWPIVRHFVTAELRLRSGLDAEPVGLGDGVTAAWPTDDIIYRHDP